MNTEPTPTLAAVDQPRIVMLFQFDGMLWTRCKLRKTMPDYWRCGAQIPKGKFAYRPLTNGYDRMKRLENVPTQAIILA
jgi:hypothetical protein